MRWDHQHRTLTWYEEGCWQAGGMFDCRQQRDSPDTCPTRHSYYTLLLCSDLMWSASDIAYSSPLYMTKRSRYRCVTSWWNCFIKSDFKYSICAPDVEFLVSPKHWQSWHILQNYTDDESLAWRKMLNRWYGVCPKPPYGFQSLELKTCSWERSGPRFPIEHTRIRRLIGSKVFFSFYLKT